MVYTLEEETLRERERKWTWTISIPYLNVCKNRNEMRWERKKKRKKNRNEKRNRQLTNLSADHTLWRTGNEGEWDRMRQNGEKKGKKKKINGSMNDNTRHTREEGGKERETWIEINLREVCLMIHSFSLFLPSSPSSFSLSFFLPNCVTHTQRLSTKRIHRTNDMILSLLSLSLLSFIWRTCKTPSVSRQKEKRESGRKLHDAWCLVLDGCSRCFFFSPLLSCRHGIVCLFLHHFTFSSHRHRHFSLSLSASQSLKSKSLLMTSERYDFLLLLKKKGDSE